MPIQIGDRLPSLTVTQAGTPPQRIDTDTLFAGKRSVLFSVPGAFTPTCSEKHLPGYVEAMPAFRAKGVQVVGMSVNDGFVMHAWGAQQQAPDDLVLLADGNADFVRALGLEMDASAYGMGVRGQRFALLVEDGIVRAVQVEAPGELRVSSAEHMLGFLD